MARQFRSKELPASVLEQTDFVNKLALSASAPRKGTFKRRHDDAQNVDGNAKKLKRSNQSFNLAAENIGLEKQSARTPRHDRNALAVANQGEGIFDVPDDDAESLDQAVPMSSSNKQQPEKTSRKRGRPRKATKQKEEVEVEFDVQDDDIESLDQAIPTSSSNKQQPEKTSRKRGRPRKATKQKEEVEAEHEKEERERERARKKRKVEEKQKVKAKEKTRSRPVIQKSNQMRPKNRPRSPQQARPSIPDDTESSDRSSTSEDDSADEQVQANAPLPRWALVEKDQQWAQVVEWTAKNRAEKEFLKPGQGEKCEVKDVEELCKKIRDMIGIYSDLVNEETEMSLITRRDLASAVEEIESKVKHIQELNQPKVTVQKENKNPRRVIEDLYLWALPGLVYLLGHCMRYWSAKTDAYDLTGLSDVSNIMDITIRTCQMASHWHVKPASERYIVRNIKSRAFPELRRMKKAFGEKLVELKREDRVIQNRKKALEDRKAQERAQVESDSADKDWESSWQAFKNSMEEKRNPLFYQPFPTSPEQVDCAGQSKQSVEWTREESRELIIQLMDRKSRHLPAEERYLEISNCPRLQNKLPEHIRDEALSLKPYLIKHYRQKDYLESIL